MAATPVAVAQRIAEAQAKSRREKKVDRATERVQITNKRLNKLCKVTLRGIEKEEVHAMCRIDIEKIALMKELRANGSDYSPIARSRNVNLFENSSGGAPVPARPAALNIEHTSRVIALQHTAVTRMGLERPVSVNSNSSKSGEEKVGSDGEIFFESVSVSISGKQVDSSVTVRAGKVKGNNSSTKETQKILDTVRDASKIAESRRRAFRVIPQGVRAASAPESATAHHPLSAIKESSLWHGDAESATGTTNKSPHSAAAGRRRSSIHNLGRHGFLPASTPIGGSGSDGDETNGTRRRPTLTRRNTHGGSGSAGDRGGTTVARERPPLTRSNTWAGSMRLEVLNRRPTQTPPLLRSAYHFPSLISDDKTECLKVLQNLKNTHPVGYKRSRQGNNLEKSTLMYLKKFNQTRANEIVASKVDAFILNSDKNGQRQYSIADDGDDGTKQNQ